MKSKPVGKTVVKNAYKNIIPKIPILLDGIKFRQE